MKNNKCIEFPDPEDSTKNVIICSGKEFSVYYEDLAFKNNFDLNAYAERLQTAFTGD